MKLLKTLLIVAGFISVGLGILGMFLPVLPTTPFLLLAATCFARSSEKFYRWLLNNKWFGNYIKNYREGKGIPLKIKIMTLSFLWATILTSAIFFLDNIYLRILLIAIAVGVTIHISLIKTKKSER
ncbi:MAG: YbaN family protein [Paludibacter sp.]|nr:YbaN family protein [Paludibacter sp.]MDD4197894.1 YbaN family protein [Paludibacter sp.]MDD4427553.1 YbaN family protein [Paludibacter sp.]